MTGVDGRFWVSAASTTIRSGLIFYLRKLRRSAPMHKEPLVREKVANTCYVVDRKCGRVTVVQISHSNDVDHDPYTLSGVQKVEGFGGNHLCQRYLAPFEGYLCTTNIAHGP